MNKTRIYSCGDSMTSLELANMWSDADMTDDDTMIDVWFPETRFSGHWGDIPLTNPEILKLLPNLIGKSIVTVSEIVILMLMREIRLGRLDDVELWCGDTRMDISKRGELISHWDGTGFFETGFNRGSTDETMLPS